MRRDLRTSVGLTVRAPKLPTCPTVVDCLLADNDQGAGVGWVPALTGDRLSECAVLDVVVTGRSRNA